MNINDWMLGTSVEGSHLSIIKGGSGMYTSTQLLTGENSQRLLHRIISQQKSIITGNMISVASFISLSSTYKNEMLEYIFGRQYLVPKRMKNKGGKTNIS